MRCLALLIDAVFLTQDAEAQSARSTISGHVKHSPGAMLAEAQAINHQSGRRSADQRGVNYHCVSPSAVSFPTRLRCKSETPEIRASIA